MKRIVVTGLGCISAIGNDVKQFETNLMQGHCGIADIERVKIYGSRTRIGAEVKHFVAEEHFPSSLLNQLDRYAQFALVSAREALKDAQLELNGELAERTAVIHGTGLGGQNTLDESFDRIYGQGEKRLHPLSVPKVMASASASQISIDSGAQGPVFGATSACASAAHSIGVALLMLRGGMADIAITGGAEAPISKAAYCAWEGLRVLAKDSCRPFSAKRGGMVLGEGAATLILETLDHAQARGAHIYAELAGFGCCADAGSLVQPCAKGMARAMALALKDAGIATADVDYINAHGTGTQQNDPTETAAIHALFANHANRLLVSSTKSMHGHTLGAASAIEAVASIAAIKHQRVPPTIGLIANDPQCDLDYVFNESREATVDVVLSNSFAFGGLNAVLAFRKYS